MANKTLSRCTWCEGDELYQHYHDTEWGVPLHDDQRLFELLILEGAQAGLAWITVLKKRTAYRQLFDQFEVNKIARYSDNKLEKILSNPAIIRNRLKVYSTRNNAKAYSAIQHEFGSFNQYLWAFIDNKPIQSSWEKQSGIPTSNEIAQLLSKDLKKRGFKFVGPTIIYAFMEASGMINNHIISCHRHRACAKLS